MGNEPWPPPDNSAVPPANSGRCDPSSLPVWMTHHPAQRGSIPARRVAFSVGPAPREPTERGTCAGLLSMPARPRHAAPVRHFRCQRAPHAASHRVQLPRTARPPAPQAWAELSTRNIPDSRLRRERASPAGRGFPVVSHSRRRMLPFRSASESAAQLTRYASGDSQVDPTCR